MSTTITVIASWCDSLETLGEAETDDLQMK